MAEITEEKAPKILIIVSQNGLEPFERTYEDFFFNQFGSSETSHWKLKGAFNFREDPAVQCFGFGLYNPVSYEINGFTNLNKPDVFIISFHNFSRLPSIEKLGCAREELAHAIFFVRDFDFVDPNFSIFNATALDGAIEDFSNFDKKLIKFIAEHRQIIGMNRNLVDNFNLD
jgi:hypothetical protein